MLKLDCPQECGEWCPREAAGLPTRERRVHGVLASDPPTLFERGADEVGGPGPHAGLGPGPDADVVGGAGHQPLHRVAQAVRLRRLAVEAEAAVRPGVLQLHLVHPLGPRPFACTERQEN